MSDINIVEVKSSAQLNSFIDYPNRLYKDDPNYVYPLKMERKEFFDFKKNPFYKTAKVKLFLAMKNREVVGRIATCINFNHNEYHQEQTGFFGFFDCPNDYDIASRLLKVALITLKKEGMEKMRGPVSFSTNHECGFLIEGFDTPPVIMMTYNYKYIPQLAEKFGFKKVMDLLAYEVVEESGVSDRVKKVLSRVQKKTQIKIRHINIKEFDKEIEAIHKVYNDAWQYNWGFVPMEKEEFVRMAKDMKQIIEPKLVLVAEHNNRPIAFSLALPDINQALIHLKGKLLPFGITKLLWHTKIKNKINRVRLITFGIIPEYQKRGIDMLMFYETFKTGTSLGYSKGELSWILEDNKLMCRGAEQMGGKIYKRYRIVEMPL